MIGKPGPFQIIEDDGVGAVEAPVAAPRRRYDCPHYETCLELAAALNWDNFTCRGCSGEVDSALTWRASQMLRKDATARQICTTLPPVSGNTPNDEGGEERGTKENSPSGQTIAPRKLYVINGKR